MVEATVRKAIKGSGSLLSIPPDPLPWEVGNVYRSVEVATESRWLGDDMTIWGYREKNQSNRLRPSNTDGSDGVDDGSDKGPDDVENGVGAMSKRWMYFLLRRSAIFRTFWTKVGERCSRHWYTDNHGDDVLGLGLR